jgi:hypothetical protein
MKLGDFLILKPNHGFDHRTEKIYLFFGKENNPGIFRVLSPSGKIEFLPHFAVELVR